MMQFTRRYFTALAPAALLKAQAQPPAAKADDGPSPTAWIPSLPAEQAAEGWRLGKFMSPTVKREVGYYYWLPAGYAHSRERFPVVYWLHGFGGTPASATAFLKRYRTAVEQDRAPRMIIISCTDPLRTSQWTDSKDGVVPVETVIIRDLLPHIEKTFRTIPGRKGRGIEGYSMGGYGAAYLGFKYPEQFCMVSALAGGMLTPERMSQVRDQVIFIKTYGRDPEYAKSHSVWTITREKAEEVKKWKPLVRVHVGDKDVSIQQSIDYHEFLVKYGIPHEWGMSPGAVHNTGQTFDTWPGNPFDFYYRAFPQTKKQRHT